MNMFINNYLRQVTLKLLWQEYGDECKKKNVLPMGYTRYCEGYSNFTNTKQLTKRIERKPGDRIEVDWSGPTMKFTDSLTGEVITVYLFVVKNQGQDCEDYKQIHLFK